MFHGFKNRINRYSILLRGLLVKDSWQHLNRCDILLVRHDNDCDYFFQKKAYAQIIDSFGDLCIRKGLTVRSVAIPFSKLVLKKATNSPVSYNRLLFINAIKGKLFSLVRGGVPGRQWSESQHTDIWCRILAKTTPKYVIGIQPDNHVCRAGKIKGIPVYDLQHGAISDADVYYGESYQKDKSPDDLPRGFLCWDDQSAKIIAKWAETRNIRVLQVGNPWFQRFYRIQQGDLLVNEAISNEEKPDDNRPRILVSLQWGLSTKYPDQVPNGVITDALEKVILETSESYTWMIRLHPIQLHGFERKMVLNYLTSTFGAEKTQEWVKESEIALPVILKKTDLHITYYSSIVMEAAWMGIRSGLLSDQLNHGGKYSDLFFYERSAGMAEVLPQNPEMIKQWILDTLAKGRGRSTLKDFGQTLDAFIDEIASAGLK